MPAQSLEISPGSALDFSKLVAPGMAGDRGRLKLRSGGRLSFEFDNKPARFNCAVISNGPFMSREWPSHEDADRLAEQLRVRGYSLVRFHYVEMRLAVANPQQDFDFDPNALDRFHYLLAALKRNGIYWAIDGITHPNGGSQDARWSGPRSVDDLKVRLNFDPAAREHWLKLVDRIYGSTNPYTGMSTLSDPALAFVVGANENSIAFWSTVVDKNGAAFPAGLETLFDTWMRARYPSKGELLAAVPGLSPSELRGDRPVALPRSWHERGPRMQAFLRFVAFQEVDAYRWMTNRLKERGFEGPLLAFPEWFAAQDNGSRASIPITDVHAYIGELSSYAIGAKMYVPSATSERGMGAILTNASARWLDRPFVMTEYGQPFPSPYRFEAGLVFPAISAFQGYAGICRHAHLSVEVEVPRPESGFTAMRGYTVGLDPVARAGETLSTLLFYRRDVSEGKSAVGVVFDGAQLGHPGSAFLPLNVRKIALLTRFGLTTDESRAKATALVRLPDRDPAKSALQNRTDDFISGETRGQLLSLVQKLRSQGVLKPENLTDLALGVYQNSSGEITLYSGRKVFAVETSRTEAVSFSGSETAHKMRFMTVNRTNAEAVVSASSLDGAPLERSRKILFILAGDARNSGMNLGGAGDYRTIRDWGRLPILLERVIADLTIAAPSGGGHFSTLNLRGEVIRKRYLASGPGGKLDLKLDTGEVPDNPTTYFIWESSGRS